LFFLKRFQTLVQNFKVILNFSSNSASKSFKSKFEKQVCNTFSPFGPEPLSLLLFPGPVHFFPLKSHLSPAGKQQKPAQPSSSLLSALDRRASPFLSWASFPLLARPLLFLSQKPVHLSWPNSHSASAAHTA
jgi:hypothetical protein